MTRIELSEDSTPSPSHTVGQTFLRAALGAVLLAHGVQRLLTFERWQDELASRFALLEPSTAAHVLIGMELAGGVGLIFGWFTRLSSLALFGSACVAFALELARQGGIVQPAGFELATLLGVTAFYFLLAGPGPASFDAWLRERARRRAIENDEMWLSYPYVAPLESNLHGTHATRGPDDTDDAGDVANVINPALATRRLG